MAEKIIIQKRKTYRFLVQCAYCNAPLFKTNLVLFASLYETEIKCPKCGRMLNRPEDVNTGGESKEDSIIDYEQ